MYTQEEIESKFNAIITDISNGDSLRMALKTNEVSNHTFYGWIDNSKEKTQQYARACEERAEAIVDEAMSIADNSAQDTKIIKRGGEEVEIVDNEVIQRSKLRFEARQWLVGKLNPKKYGNKIDVTTDGEKIQSNLASLSNEDLMQRLELINKIDK